MLAVSTGAGGWDGGGYCEFICSLYKCPGIRLTGPGLSGLGSFVLPLGPLCPVIRVLRHCVNNQGLLSNSVGVVVPVTAFQGILNLYGLLPT